MSRLTPAALRALATTLRWLMPAALLWLLLGASVRADQLSAEVDRSQLQLGETLQLVLEFSGNTGQGPDLSPLQQQFEILGRSQRSMVSWVNGVQTSSTAWIIQLAPKSSGQLTIPSLQVGSASSAPLTIEVSDAPAAAPGSSGTDDGSTPSTMAGEPLLVVADVDRSRSFEQAEINYRLRIYASVPILAGNLSEPQLDGLTIRRQGEEKRYREQRNGQEYQVIERNYSLLAERSGSFTIPPQTLQARIPSAVGQPQSFGGQSLFNEFMDPGQVVAVRSNPVTIEVKARPAAASGWFLPATAVSLSQRWQPEPPQLKVGEAVTRTIRLEAVGATPTQLPKLALAEVKGARQYLEHEQSRSEETAAGRAAVLEQTITLIPLQPGPLTLPELRVEWWDSASDSPQVALLPATTLQVSGGAASNTADGADLSATGDQPAADMNADSASAGNGPSADANGGAEPQVATTGVLSSWLMALLVVTAVVAAALGWRVARRRPSPSPLASAHHQLLQACRQDNASAALQALHLFTRAGGQLPPAAQPHIDQLHAALYSPTPSPWRGQALAQLLAPGRRWRRQPKAEGVGLPPLYPR